jgi:CheY-like chemotaxis protein
VARAIETSRPLIDTRRHELVVALPEQPLAVHGDMTRLSQVIGNLLNNAAKYTEPGGRIVVRVEQEGHEAVIRVQDNGIGISGPMLQKVFDLFTQGDRALDRQSGGLGIGLALVRRLVAMHGGTVSAHSAGLGHGTEMIVRLPSSSEKRSLPPQPPETDESASPAIRSCRILIVDDNKDAADSIALSVQLAGHTVCTAYDGQEGLALASTFAPDVLLLDLGMPGLNGYEIARRIRQQPWGKTLALIAVTGWGQEQDRRRTKEAGFNAHLTKPVSPSELLGALGTAIQTVLHPQSP